MPKEKVYRVNYPSIDRMGPGGVDSILFLMEDLASDRKSARGDTSSLMEFKPGKLGRFNVFRADSTSYYGGCPIAYVALPRKSRSGLGLKVYLDKTRRDAKPGFMCDVSSQEVAGVHQGRNLHPDFINAILETRNPIHHTPAGLTVMDVLRQPLYFKNGDTIHSFRLFMKGDVVPLEIREGDSRELFKSDVIREEVRVHTPKSVEREVRLYNLKGIRIKS